MSTTTFARVDPETLEVTLKYNTNGGSKWGESDIPCEIPFDVLADRAVLVDDQVTLVEDPTKISDHKATLWSQLRAQRNQLLKDSDWTQGNDSPLSTESKSAWAAYRAALRNLPDVTSDPSNVEWPQSP